MTLDEATWLSEPWAERLVRHLLFTDADFADKDLDPDEVRRYPPLASDRKLRLIAIACNRTMFRSQYQRASTPFAVAGIAWDDWLLGDQKDPPPNNDEWIVSQRDPALAALTCADSRGQGDIIRDIIGNPFRPLVLPRGERTARCTACDGTGSTGEFFQSVCEWCEGDGKEAGPCFWLTPTVVALARGCYEERPGRKCEAGCVILPNPAESMKGKRLVHRGYPGGWDVCHDCGGTSRIQDGTLDPERLAVLSDALEDAGCPTTISCDCLADWCDGRKPHPLLAHLRSPGPHVRGCWAVDLVLGLE